MGWLILHFSLIGLVGTRDFLSLPESNTSGVPVRSKGILVKAKAGLSRFLGEDSGSPNVFYWEGLACYTNAAGIELGYSYFAPSIPESCMLIFELHYPDGSVAYDLPGVGGEAAGYRFVALLDRFHHLESSTLREALALTLVSSIWEEHRDATGIRAIFGRVDLPGAAEFRAGRNGSYRRLSEYDFVPASRPAQSHSR